ncbi:MAG: hypothetical protein IOD12_10705 [Silvanigrellales bacterium]|nr:hypothetical protein [Silvanigrellales bacterium]
MKQQPKASSQRVLLLAASLSTGVAWAQSVAPGVVDIPDSLTATTHAAADSQKQIREELFDALVKFNLDAWNELLQKEILLSDTRLKAELDEQSSRLDALIAREKEARAETLRLASSRVPSTSESLEASLHLASLLLVDDALSGEAGMLLDSVLRAVTQTRVEARLEMSARLLRAQRFLSLKRFGAARTDYEAIVELARRSDARTGEMAIRAHLGLGDVAYGEFLFQKAEGHYVQALRGVQRAALSDHAALEPTLAGLYVRLVWSSFRSGRALSTATYAAEYARRRETLSKRPPASVEDELVRVAGIASFERSDRAADTSLASDPRAGDFGKKILLASLAEEIRAGTFARGAARARALSKPFLESSSAFAFLETNSVLSENAARSPADRRRAKREKDAEAVLLAARGSSWARAFDSQPALRERRRSVLLRLGEATGAAFAEEGRASGRPEDFLKSHAVYKARLGEFFEGESRGVLLLASAESALLCGALEDAWNEARLAFRHPLSRDAERLAFVLLVRASEGQSTGALSPTDPFFSRYLSAVDAFVGERSEDAEARQALFASGVKLNRLGYPAEALDRYERALALVPRRAVARDEIENVLRGLLVFHMTHSEPSVAAGSLSEMETIARENDVNVSLRVEIELAAAAQIRLHASDLRRRGLLDAAAQAQLLWSQKHALNPEAAPLLRDAIIGFHEAGQWKKAREGIDIFLRRFDKHSFMWDVLALRGRVDEAQLAFQSAALSYVAAAFDDVSNLSTARRIEVLSRAALLLAQGGSEKEAANVRKKIAELRGSSDKEGASAELTTAGQLLLRAGDPRQAAGLFERAAELTQEGSRARLRRLEALEANSLWRDVVDADIKALESVVLRRAKNERSESARSGGGALAVRALALGNRRLESLLQGEGSFGLKTLRSALATLERLDALAAPFVKKSNDDGDVSARAVSARVSLSLSRAYATVHSFATRTDAAMADRLRVKARTTAFDAFLSAPKGSDIRAAATRELRMYTSVASGELPPLEPVPPETLGSRGWGSDDEPLVSGATNVTVVKEGAVE